MESFSNYIYSHLYGRHSFSLYPVFYDTEDVKRTLIGEKRQQISEILCSKIELNLNTIKTFL